MEKLKVLIVDDSVVYRSQIRAALQEIPWVEVKGVASNGRLALEHMKRQLPDLLILDIEMPEMDGLATLREMSKLNLRCKVLLFSIVSKRGAEITIEALKLGATDFVTKPAASSAAALDNPAAKIKELIAPKLHMLFPNLAYAEERSTSLSSKNHRPSKVTEIPAYPPVIIERMQPEVIVIGASTGGPTVLERIFSDLPGPLQCPILIAQHMPPVFTATFAERLGRLSGLDIAEAKNGETLQPNKVYVAPGDYHLRLCGTPGNVTLTLDQGPHINSVRPAVDPLFDSAAKIFKNRCLAFVLTGMGADGKVGAMAVKESGGGVVIQNEDSCVVFGMPGAVFGVGAYDRAATPQEIVQILREKTMSPNLPKVAS